MGKRAKAKTTKKFVSGEVYPNSPLIEVVCEIRFPGDLAIECKRDIFYDKIKDAYPNILVPQVRPGVVLPCEPYRFEREDHAAGIMLSINKFSFYLKKYEGHENFIKEFKRLAEILGTAYSVDKLNRIGWRYINLIPYTRKDGIVPLNRFLNIAISTPGRAWERLENLSFVLVSRVTNGSITTKIESVRRKDAQEEALVLDFDFAMTEGLSFSKLGKYVKISHEHTRALFEELITDEYRQYLRGQTI